MDGPPCAVTSRGQRCLLVNGHFGVGHQYPPPPILEKNIQQSCAEILEWDGWRRVRLEQNFSERKRKVIGEPGMADDLFIRYLGGQKSTASDYDNFDAEVIWIEWKRLLPSKRGKTWGRATKASIQQKAWHAQERARGALTLIAGEDFTATIEGFKAWYGESGLKRR